MKMQVRTKLPGTAPMGRVTVDIELKNHRDVILADAGQMRADEIRTVVVAGIVDTGAASLVIPKHIATELGVPVAGEVKVRYADQRRATRSLVEDVEVHLLGRKGTHNAIVEPRRKDVLIGAIVLEDLDLVVDCKAQELRPRDPEGMFFEID